MKKTLLLNRLITTLTICLLCGSVFAQQFPDSGFEDWSGATFDGNIQPKYWNPSNVTQLGFKFNFSHQETGRSGKYCLMVQDQALEVAGIGATSPGYFALGTPWAYVPSLTEINKATAGTYGGIAWNYRPDSLQVWVKRMGPDVDKEDFYIVYYAWKGTAKGGAYAGKTTGSCTSYSATDEESDIRQAMNANECQTIQYATQVAEGYFRHRTEYKDWTLVTLPILYINDEVPEKVNVIFSAGNYPNFRANSGMYDKNSLYVDDVKLIYSSKIQKLFVGNKEWKGFDPNSTDEQIYSVGNSTSIPDIYAMRGAGSFENTREKVNFQGRRLSGDEISIQEGEIDGAPTIITVKAEDGSSTTIYKIKFISTPSNNARLAGIQVNGESLSGFNGYVSTYNIALPYGTTVPPVVEAIKAEDGQLVTITQATSLPGQATIVVTAPDGVKKMTYTLNFSVAQLSDNTLMDIRIDGESLAGFRPTTTNYRVELPLGTTILPVIEAVSAYGDGEQTITHTPPLEIDGGVYQIAVSAPGNSTTRTYRLNFKITASTNTNLRDLQVVGFPLEFDPSITTYYVTLPLGTTTLPDITYVEGDRWQTVTMTHEGIDGTSRITVKSASNDEKVYKIVFNTIKSEVDYLNNIYLDGVPLSGFDKYTNSYTHTLPIGTTTLPSITYEKGDEWQNVDVRVGGLEGTTRITVTAQDGSVNLYQIHFSVMKATDASLRMIFLDGVPLEGFLSETLEYTITLPQGTTSVPVATWTAADEWQTITARQATDLNGETRITVRPQEGVAQTYVIRFSVNTSSNTALRMINVDGIPLADFEANKTEYTITLPEGVSVIPEVTYEKEEEIQKVFSFLQNTTHILRVTAENGDTRTYTLNFVIQKSANAFLRNIYLDGTPLEGFSPEQLTGYVVTLTGAECPIITVDKMPGQTISIVAPISDGEAKITVQPEEGASNVYVIRFQPAPSIKTNLQNILLDEVGLPGFIPTQYAYTISYVDSIPVVSVIKGEDAQSVIILKDKELVTICVKNGSESQEYLLTFVQNRSDNTFLDDILLDGSSVSGFSASKLLYDVDLEPGQALPMVTYKAGNEKQSIIAGWISEVDYQLHVTAENGETNTYLVHFNCAQYSDATLLDIRLDGTTITGFEPTKFSYNKPWIKDVPLPELSYTKRAGQNVLQSQTSYNQQQIIVVADNGTQNTYTINYNVTLSDNALLQDILVDGVSLAGFDSHTYNYVYNLAWRTKVVPIINPISAAEGQTITINYSAINGTTTIHVVAANNIATADYTIAFPVAKSANADLESVELEGVNGFVFDANQTTYEITLPYGVTEAPLITYKQAEPEQTIRFVNAPVTEPTIIEVTAENGDVKTYIFKYTLTYSDKPNRLASIRINDSQEVISLAQEIDAEHIEVRVDMPYGTEEFNVVCTENFAEQTMFVQQGGTKYPTIVTLYANRGEEKPVTYTIIPNISQQNPAHLTGISVNGTPIVDFDRNQCVYVVDLMDGNVFPNVSFTSANGAITTSPIQNSKVWEIQVNAAGYSNTYKVIFHYPNDIIPNADFVEWTKAAKRTSADKPMYWQVAADYEDTHLGTAKTGSEVTMGGDDQVKMTTTYWAALKSAIPSVMTLGELKFTFGVAGATSSTFSGGVPFHNTPDSVAIRYNLVNSVGNGTLFAFRFFENGAERSYDYVTTTKTEGMVTYTHPLGTDKLSAVQSMNIAVNATNQESNATPTSMFSSDKAELYVDWFRFIYNSKLDSLAFGEEVLSPSGTTFTYSFDDPFADTKPALRFYGQVSDQSRKVEWSDEKKEGDKAVRIATITNYAEDGTSTVYTLKLTRPLSTHNTLSLLQVGGQNILQADIFEYTIELSETEKIPTIVANRQNNFQQVEITYAGNVVTITVTPEYGEAKVYKVTFNRKKSNDTKLANIEAAGITFDADTRDYNLVADQLPEILFTKASDKQTVELKQGVLTVKAEDGTIGTYTIKLTPAPKATSGYLTKLALDDNDIQGFAKDNFDYTAPAPHTTSFVREYDTDSVEQVISPTGITWKVMGTTTNTYHVTYPTGLSNNANLSNITLDNAPLDGFLGTLSDYEIITDNNIDLLLTPANNDQTLNIKYADNIFTIGVEAADGTKRATDYTLAINPDLSNIATLNMIYVAGQPIAAFRPDSLVYTVELPCDNPKLAEPIVPEITYTLGQAGQRVEITPAALGQVTYINVHSEDGRHVQQYELTIAAEPSHNAQLTNILLNGAELKGFDTNRYWYSAQINTSDVRLQYSTADNFQTVVEKRGTDGEYILEVTAQDGTTVKEYQITIWTQNQSNNAYLKNILLNGASFKSFDAAADEFDSKQLRYNLTMPTSVTTLPDVFVQLQESGQTWELLQGTDVDTIRVTAPDGITKNDYILNFVRVKSNNADLAMIYVAGEPLADFEPNKTTYRIDLPVGTTDLPAVDVFTAEAGQTYTSWTEDNTMLYTVTAEDETTRKIYVLDFNFMHSEADTLMMVFEDGVPRTDFAPHTFYYSTLLPVGVRTVPAITYEQADRWQDITMETIVSGMNTTYQITVVADSGRKNVYTLVYQLQQSEVDTLQMIYVDNRELVDFVATTNDYTLTIEEGRIPSITWAEGDAYQTIDTVMLDDALKINVNAESGRQRTYTLTFITPLSNNVDLSMITLAGRDVPNFDPEVLIYNISLPYGTTDVPAVTFTKEEAEQNVTLEIRDWTVLVTVVAADGVTTQTYIINLSVERSDNAFLDAINLDGELMAGFAPEQTEYDITLPFGTDALPIVTYDLGDEQQVVEMTVEQDKVIILVTSGDGVNIVEYIIRFVIELSPINTLTDLALAGTTIEGFDATVNEYYITFPAGTSVDELYKVEDVTYALLDSTASAIVVEEDEYTFSVIVTAANGDVNAYIIHQEISLPNNALLADLTLNGTTIEGFAPEVFEYEYLLLEGGVMPTIDAVAQDSTAEVSVTMGNVGDTTYIYCTAQDGTEYVYTVYVHYSDLKTVDAATSQDVILKHIPGTNQYLAATTRQGIQIVFFNLQGQKVQAHNVPICDPNAVNVTIDAKGNELLADVDVSSTGAIITIDNNTPLVYVFLQNDTKLVSSGKLVLIQ